MALTATEEAQARELIAQQAALLSLASNEVTITSKLGATKVNLSQLPAASALADTDVFLVRQGTEDKSVTGDAFKAFATVPDATDAIKGKVELATSAETQAGTDATRAVTPAGLRSVLSNGAGEVAFFARNTAPSGWLKANGAAVSRTTYADLFAAIGTTFGAGDGSTTFNVPDMRGEFPRGWDDGRGIDAGRVFGSSQASQNLEHDHTFTYGDNPLSSGSGGAANSFLTNGTLTKTTAKSGGTESRPRNVALLACIKF